ncbi:MAG: hypothetical protein ACYC01_01865 [Lutibacter sp.]
MIYPVVLKVIILFLGLPAFLVGVPFAKANVRLSALAFFAEKRKKALKHLPQSLTRIETAGRPVNNE